MSSFGNIEIENTEKIQSYNKEYINYKNIIHCHREYFNVRDLHNERFRLWGLENI
jgi:hypothetical protein